MKKAGAGDTFRYSPAHAVYIKAAKDHRLASSANPFKAYRISEVAPQAGDLVCKTRAGSGATYENIQPGHTTHCDIVTAVQLNRLTTIGGNVNNSVSRTFVTTNADGYITQPGYFAVIRLSTPAPSGTLEVEPFEVYTEFDGEWEQEARRGGRIPSRTMGFRQRPFRRPSQLRRRRPPRLPWLSLGWPVAVIREPSVVEPAQEGSEYVRWVQSALNRVMSLRLPVDGIMGPETRSAIRSFQQRQGLPVNGIVGPETQRALIAAGASQPPETGEFFEAYSAFDNQLEYSLGDAAVCKPDTTTNGKLCSFNSKNGGSTTAVYVPDAARNTDPLSLLVWVHGDLICGDEKGRNAVAYVKSKTFPLVKQLADSKRPFVLVAPSMNWKSGQNSHMLGSPQTMNAFLEEVRTKLTAAGWSSAPSFGRLILAGHSRAYAVFNGLAARVSDVQSSQGALATLTDVWLFDTTYGARNKKALVTNWMRWAKAKSGVNLRIFYRRNSGTADVAEGIRDEAAKARLTNVVFEHFDPNALSHCAMPRVRMPDLLAAAGNYPARSKGPSAPSPTPRPSNASLLQRIHNALASGQWSLALNLAVLSGDRDANRLTNMIFFARHPTLQGRKLVATDPAFKQRSQEWSDIRDRIVRPFLAKTVRAKPLAR